MLVLAASKHLLYILDLRPRAHEASAQAVRIFTARTRKVVRCDGS